MIRSDEEVVKAVLGGDEGSFEELVTKYQSRIFATARRYARRESEAEDIVQEVFIKAFQKLATFRGEAPFEHWIMRLSVHVCYDFLRQHQRNREISLASLTDSEEEWLERFAVDPKSADEHSEAARVLVQRLLSMLSPASRLIITLLEIEEQSVKEIAALTGWSIALVKVRAFRARHEMQKCLTKINRAKYL